MELQYSDVAEKQQKHFHVLAVDDSLVERKLLERLLGKSSCKVTSVDSGYKALKYLGLLNCPENDTTSSSSSLQPKQDQDYSNVNLIMTDYSMPGMSGYDLLTRIKGSCRKDIPVVVMSSENVPSRISMCLEGGAVDFLLKPLRLSDLKKLQPHLLKSLVHCSKNINNSTGNRVQECVENNSHLSQ